MIKKNYKIKEELEKKGALRFWNDIERKILNELENVEKKE